MSFAPYLSFKGTCAQAMTFYAGVFGSKDLQIMANKDAPVGSIGPDADPALVMHAQLSVDGWVLMADDTAEGAPPPGTSGRLFHSAADEVHARAVFEALGDGGTVQTPFGPTFWSKGFGTLRDRFGTEWMVTFGAPD